MTCRFVPAKMGGGVVDHFVGFSYFTFFSAGLVSKYLRTKIMENYNLP